MFSRRHRTLSFESLETRRVMAVNVIQGDLHIDATSGSDTVLVSELGSNYRVSVNGRATDVARSKVWGGDVFCNLSNGHDRFNNSTALRRHPRRIGQ